MIKDLRIMRHGVFLQSWRYLVEGDEGSFLPDCQTNFVFVVTYFHELFLLFLHFVNTTAYHLS